MELPYCGRVVTYTTARLLNKQYLMPAYPVDCLGGLSGPKRHQSSMRWVWMSMTFVSQ